MIKRLEVIYGEGEGLPNTFSINDHDIGGDFSGGTYYTYIPRIQAKQIAVGVTSLNSGSVPLLTPMIVTHAGYADYNVDLSSADCANKMLYMKVYRPTATEFPWEIGLYDIGTQETITLYSSTSLPVEGKEIYSIYGTCILLLNDADNTATCHYIYQGVSDGDGHWRHYITNPPISMFGMMYEENYIMTSWGSTYFPRKWYYLDATVATDLDSSQIELQEEKQAAMNAVQISTYYESHIKPEIDEYVAQVVSDAKDEFLKSSNDNFVSC